MRCLTCLFALALLAGCDSGDPDSSSTAQLVVETPLDDLALHVGESQEIELAEHFRHSDGAPLTFEAQRDSGSSVEIMSIEDGQMRLEAQSEGRTIIAVTAASALLEASATFAVDVAPGLCPSEPSPDQADYFPMEAGQVWLFDYRHRSGPMNSGGTQREGQLSMTFESVTCVNRVRTAQVREVAMVDGMVYRQATRTFTEDSTNTLRMELPGGYVHFDADPYEVYPVPRYVVASSSDTLTYRQSASGDAFLGVVQEGGIVEWNWSACDPILCESIGLDRVE